MQFYPWVRTKIEFHPFTNTEKKSGAKTSRFGSTFFLREFHSFIQKERYPSSIWMATSTIKYQQTIFPKRKVDKGTVLLQKV